MKRITMIMTMLFTGFVLINGQTKPGDMDINDAIENEYIYDHAVNNNKVDVMVTDGIVELTGEVTNLKAKERATKIAELVKGVRSVSNRIEVDPPENLGDHVIQDMVEQALLKDPATDLFEIDVSVENSEVTLTGIVDSYQESKLVADVAKSVKGVTALENDIEVNYKEKRTDYEVRNEIRAALKWNEMIDDGMIRVVVDEGHVNLIGSVASAAEKTNAMHTSWVAGVTAVDVSDLNVEWWLEDKDLRKYKDANVTDAEIESAILDAAIYDPRVNSFDITVDADLAWVTLRGNVDNLKAKKAARMLAENTYGVKGVTNRIKVKTDDVEDAEVQAAINESLSDNAITEAWDIGVFVKNGVATLAGRVDSYLEKVEAEWVASNVEGVNEVNNILEISYPYGYYWYGNYPYYDLYITRPSDFNVVPDDERLKAEVSREIWWSPYVDRDQVQISVENGIVRLDGTVDSFREYREAAENAWEGGAYAVENELVIR